MGRRIILLSDGTGNTSAKVWRTNVWRVFERLDLSGSDQVACYDDGVGSSTFKPVAILGGVFGYGLKRNVIDLYKFACRNYRSPDDEIFGFGFSRGAFTMRIVIALILKQGLVKASSEQELHAHAQAAYRAYRREGYHTFLRIETPLRWIRDLFVRTKYSKSDNRQNAKIRFLGLWDSVAAYGMPIEEMARGLGQWIWPWELPDLKLDSRVRRACQALSIDDERTTFHPVFWDEREEEQLAPRQDGKRYLSDERISQVWFPGVHSNVGGGYPDDSVAQIPLVWLMSEAQTCGLQFKSSFDASPQTYGYPRTAQDKDGRIYDPRSGFGSYYRYGPRNISKLCADLLSRKNTPALPKIHESVLKRVQNNAHLYAPKGIPGQYEVVTADCEVLSPQQNPYETPTQAQARSNAQERIWNTIWLRQIVYFLTVIVSLYLVAFPLLRALPRTAELSHPLRWVSDIIRITGGFLPHGASTWINGYARDPSQFIAVGGILIALILLSSRLAGGIQNRMGLAWNQSVKSELIDGGKPTDWVYRLRTNPTLVAAHGVIKKYIAPFLFAVLFVYLGVTLTVHVLFVVQDDAGWVCKETGTKDSLEKLAPGEIILASRKSILPTQEMRKDLFKSVPNLPVFNTKELCQSTGIWLERGRKYLIRFESTDSFFDASIPASRGFYSTDPRSFWTKAAMIAAVPLRRELIRPWFRVVVRIGGIGGEESFLDPDPTDRFLINTEITATRDGELFLFVNDAVIGIPGLYDWFYQNNAGSTRVLIMRR